MDLVVRQMQTNRCTQVVVGTDPMILSYLLKICNWTMNLYLTLNFGVKFAKCKRIFLFVHSMSKKCRCYIENLYLNNEFVVFT